MRRSPLLLTHTIAVRLRYRLRDDRRWSTEIDVAWSNHPRSASAQPTNAAACRGRSGCGALIVSRGATTKQVGMPPLDHRLARAIQ
jgi:hypothetical protein